MAAGDSKGGSDLDVFEGLGKKTTTRAPASAPRNSAPPPPPSLRQPDAQKKPAPPPPLSTPPPPPANLGYAKTVPQPATSSAPSAPSNQAPRTPPPPPPGRGALPAVVAPPSKSSVSSGAMSAPGMSVKALSTGAALPVPAAARPSHGTGALDMDWDEEEEATHVLDRDATKADAFPLPGGGRRAPLPSPKQTLIGMATQPIGAPPGARPPSLPPPPPSAAQPYARPPASPPAPSSPSVPPPPPPASMRPAAPPPPAPSVVVAAAPPPAQPPPQSQSQPQQNGASSNFPYQQNTTPLAMPARGAAARPPAAPLVDDSPVLPAPYVRNRMEATAVVRPQERPVGLFAAAGAGVVALVAVGLFLMPHSGQIAINVADTKGSAVRNLQVSVDGKLQCDSAPCLVHNLSSGSHTVKVEATGYEPPADKAVAVESGRDTTVDFTLTPMAPSGGTGIKVAGSQPGEKLFVDDREIGALPQEIHDLAPGSHRVRVAASDRYAAVEKTVNLAKDEFQDLGAVTLKVVKGRATVSLATPGAKVFLVSGSDRRELPTLPMSVDLDPSKQYSLMATKAGYNDFAMPLSFDDGQAEKAFTVSLDPKTVSQGTPSMAFSPAPQAYNPPPSAPPPPTPHAAPPREAAPPHQAASTASAAGEGTLNMNSIPSSSVVLDGKPIGNTPQIGITVSAGTHTVVFVNAEQGFKKQVSVTVAAGETKKVHP